MNRREEPADAFARGVPYMLMTWAALIFFFLLAEWVWLP